jgi:hypothetical protein
MTVRRISRSDLRQPDAALFADHTVVLMTPVTADATWAAECAWELARAAAVDERNVALIDLSLEHPLLDPHPPSEGIVDAFLYGASLNHVAQAQDVAGLYFVSAGSYAANPTEVWESPRWSRLAMGFAQEGALLLALVPPSALSRCTLNPDALVVLAPRGYNHEDEPEPGIAHQLATGVPTMTVVWDPEIAPPGAQAAPEFRPVAVEELPTPSKDSPVVQEPEPALSGAPSIPAVRDRGLKTGTRRLLLAAPPIAVIVVGVSFWLTAGKDAGQDANIAPRPVIAASAPVVDEADRDRGDTLFYSVQVAAFNAAQRAIAYAVELERDDLAAAVTPVRIGNQGIWFRVILGLFPHATAADSVLQVLWQRGVVERRQGNILRTPQALDLGSRPTVAEARSEVSGLRARGIPAYIVRAPTGSAQILVGAFEAPEQAAVAESLLVQAGITANLVTRLGTVP